MVDLESLENPDEITEVKELISRHRNLTGSLLANRVLKNWQEMLPKIVKIMPKDYKRMLLALQKVNLTGLTGDEAAMAAFELNIHDFAQVSGN